jgi:Glycosyltransferase family 87
MSISNTLVKYSRWLLLGPLAICAGISLRVGISGALASGKDLQWAGAYLVRAGIDPWQASLLGRGREIAHFSQPHYLHELYILLLPISLLSFQHAIELWCVLNILLSIACIYFLKKLFSLSRTSSIAILLLLWISTPYRATLQAGQISALELCLLCAVFYFQNSTLRGLALGFGFSNYSFAPVVVSFLWFKHNIRTLVIAAIVPVLGLFAVWGMIGGSFAYLATEPFAVSQIDISPGMADLTTAIEATAARCLPTFSAAKTLAYGVGLLLSGIYGFYLSRRRLTDGALLTLIAVAALFTVKHFMNNYIFLVVPLSYAASERGRPIRLIALPLIGLFWFMVELFPELPLNAGSGNMQLLSAVAASCLLGAFLTYLTWSIIKIERTYSYNRPFAKPEPQGLAGAISAI